MVINMSKRAWILTWTRPDSCSKNVKTTTCVQCWNLLMFYLLIRILCEQLMIQNKAALIIHEFDLVHLCTSLGSHSWGLLNIFVWCEYHRLVIAYHNASVTRLYTYVTGALQFKIQAPTPLYIITMEAPSHGGSGVHGGLPAWIHL